MTFTELCKNAAKKANLPQTVMSKAIKGLLDCVSETLCTEGKCHLPQFGVFKALERSERTMKLPNTGEEYTCAAHKVVHFKASKKLKGAINS